MNTLSNYFARLDGLSDNILWVRDLADFEANVAAGRRRERALRCVDVQTAKANAVGAEMSRVMPFLPA